MYTSPNRLPAPAGKLVDHENTINFSFEGTQYTGLAGDTIASALAANDVWLLSRSFKYHRPRGVLSMAGLEANTLVQVDNEPNVAADRRKVTHGLQVSGQNCIGSLANDQAEKISLVNRFLPVGFYYKAFFQPKGAWQNIWEPVIRKFAGLGQVHPGTPHGYYDKQYLFSEITVVGGGPAGMSAALAAADAGAEVLLIEQETVVGGSLNYGRFDTEGTLAHTLHDELVTAVTDHSNIEIMTGSVCNGYFADNWLPVIRGHRMYKLRTRELILAPGKMEQPAIFRNNDLPGVLLGTAAQRLIRLYGVRPGKQAVVLTAGDDGYATALELLENGVNVTAVADLRQSFDATPLYEKVLACGISIHKACTVYEALPDKHTRGIRAAALRQLVDIGQYGNEAWRYDCDLLCVSVGFMPSYQLALHAGGKLKHDEAASGFSITGLPACIHLAGAVNGKNELGSVIESGRQAGQAASRKLGLAVPGAAASKPANPISYSSINHPWPIFPHPRGKEFVDLDEDLQYLDIIHACRDGYDELELVKRYSTVGMGPSQGRHSALATARVVAKETQRTMSEVGVTTARPPLHAENLAVIAGRSFEPERLTAMHHRHLEAGAHMVTAGQWWRPAYYGEPQHADRWVLKENLAVRNNVGMIDVSTLGGLEVRGPDAAEFLNRMYTFSYSRQKTGTLRYLLMTNPAGRIIDDGVACRLDDEHFYITATTGGVETVYRTMLWWNAQWRLDVDVTNVTSAYAGISLAGPKSRAVLQKLCNSTDLAPASFPYLSVRTAQVAGIPARLLRVGFVGELGYEIHAPSLQGEALWDALLKAGREFGMQPVGIEAQRLLRLEKGHLIVGQDTDAMTTPHEARMTWAVAERKPFFVGGRSLQAARRYPSNRKLVGFSVEPGQDEVPGESSLILDGDSIAGHITSVGYSPTLNKIIGMGYARADTEPGMLIQIKLKSGCKQFVQVVEMPFYDPENKRQEM